MGYSPWGQDESDTADHEQLVAFAASLPEPCQSPPVILEESAEAPGLRGNSPRFLLSCDMNLVQLSSIAQSCPTLCDPMERNTSGLPVHHQLLELPQTQVH